ncbi:MAG: hypothetical protein XU14_C0103G0002 [Armatimonadetes bacterium CSP1-3]|nr:MAG: hypothetical protein XU14_C0103G0002 [Armatimonadetes bacterium CSP1-3]
MIEQARRVLAHLEAASVGPAADTLLAPLPGRARGALQIPLPLSTTSPIEEELLALSVENMSPLEALNRLSELRERARAARRPEQRPRDKRVQ